MVGTRKDAKNADAKPQSNTIPVEWEKIIRNIVAEETKILKEKIQLLEKEIELLKDQNLKICDYSNTDRGSQNNYQQPDNDELNVSNSTTDTIIEVKTHTQISEEHHKKDKINLPNKRRKEAEIVGTSKDQSSELAAARRIWVYVGRCRSDLTVEQLTSYLQSQSPGKHFEVEKLITKGRNSAFKVGTDFELKDAIYSPSYWPENILIKRFHFFRTRTAKNKPSLL